MPGDGTAQNNSFNPCLLQKEAGAPGTVCALYLDFFRVAFALRGGTLRLMRSDMPGFTVLFVDS